MKNLFFILMLTSALLFKNSDTHAQEVKIELEAETPPPVLPTYVQPPCPVEGHMWSPGYWAYSPTGYYWVPGVWVRPPHHGLFWTPGYWSFADSRYGWHPGYWGPRVGYYGGVCYGYGYSGSGYYGGRWEGESFQYNTYVNTVNTANVHNTYSNNIGINNTVVNHSSFNGEGGVKYEPNTEEKSAMQEKHQTPTTEQQTHQAAAAQDKKQYYSANKGKPATTAMNSTNGQRFDAKGKTGKDPKAKEKPSYASTSPVRNTRTRKTSFKSSTKVSIPKTHTRSSGSYYSSSSGSKKSSGGSKSSTSNHSSSRSSSLKSSSHSSSYKTKK